MKLRKLLAMGLTLVLACGTMASPVMAKNEESSGAMDPSSYYEEYDAKTGKVTRIPYSSTPSWVDPSVPVESANSDIMPFGVVGSVDSRKRVTTPSASPYNGIVRIDLVYEDGGRGTGTGFLISPTVVVTCAHNIRRAADNVWCTGATTVYSLAKGKSFHYSKSGTKGSWGTYHYKADDYGYIILSEPINNVYYFDLAAHDWKTEDAGKDNEETYTIAGFCEDKGYTSMYKDSGALTTYTSSEISSRYIFRYPIDTYRGQSGAPIYNSNGTAVGLHAYERGGEDGYNCTSNQGVFFDQNVINFFYKFL